MHPSRPLFFFLFFLIFIKTKILFILSYIKAFLLKQELINYWREQETCSSSNVLDEGLFKTTLSLSSLKIVEC